MHIYIMPSPPLNHVLVKELYYGVGKQLKLTWAHIKLDGDIGYCTLEDFLQSEGTLEEYWEVLHSS